MARYRLMGQIKLGVLGLLVLLGMTIARPSNAIAQFGAPLLDLSQLSQAVDETEEAIASDCVRLDGYCAFRVAAPRSDLRKRISTIETALAQIQRQYIASPEAEPEIELVQPESPDPPETPPSTAESATNEEQPEAPAPVSPSIRVAIASEDPIKLMNVSRFDAALKGVDVTTAAESYGGQVKDILAVSRRERSPAFLLTQLGTCLGVGGLLVTINWALGRREEQLRNAKGRLMDSIRERSQSLQSVLDERQQWNITEAQLRFSQLVRSGLWIGGALFVVSRFPYTRIVAVTVIDSLYIPVRLLVISLIIYLAIRLSFALINRLTGVLASSYEITPELNRRMQLRVNTISRVSRGLVILVWLGVGFLSALSAVGLNIGPLLAGAGIIGLALSLPAQSLIKDAINGFFIILEDQYAVGDIITVHDIRGLVENINLRITQIRDEEGRLVTIPNSEIQLIANHSSRWSQADINIPISYHANVDQVLTLIEKVGQEMEASDRWQGAILAKPEVLGVEDFGERGLIIRVWIKTQPLKQWEVAREYRRRLKVALDAAGIVIPAHIDFKAPNP